MNGEHTLDELCNGLEPAHREILTHLVEPLLQRGVVKNEVSEVPEVLPEFVRHQFSMQIEYIDHFLDQPQNRFKIFRNTAQGS